MSLIMEYSNTLYLLIIILLLPVPILLSPICLLLSCHMTLISPPSLSLLKISSASPKVPSSEMSPGLLGVVQMTPPQLIIQLLISSTLKL